MTSENSFERPAYKVEAVTPENVHLLLDIRKKMDQDKPEAKLIKDSDKFARAENKSAFIAEDKDIAVGFVQVNLNEDGHPAGAPPEWNPVGLAYLDRIGVLDEYQRRGIGSMLLQQAEDYAKANAKKGIWLDYLANNEAAAGLYASNGFIDAHEFKDTKKGKMRRITVKMFC